MSNENQSIHDMKKDVLHGMADTLSGEQFLKFKEMIENMSDNEFIQLVAEIRHKQNTGEFKIPTTKEFMNMKRDIRNALKVEKEDSGLNHIEVLFMSEENNKKLLERMSVTKPTDIIRLTEEGDKKIMHLWEHSREEKIKEEGLTIPSDLFFANTIPLMDCEIFIDERKSGGQMVHFRVVIFPDYKERIADTSEVDVSLVGAVELLHKTDTLSCSTIIPILVKYGVDIIFMSEMAHRNMTPKLIENYKQKTTMSNFLKMGLLCLETWYGIQVSLLHPTVKDVFKKPRTAPEKQESKINPRRNRKPAKIRYVREHIVNATELAESVFGKTKDGKSINRKALVWYVIGHWRIYEDGRKVFVKPHFKGALREAGLPLDTREREIINPDSAEKNDE
jgi:hypothetical protein